MDLKDDHLPDSELRERIFGCRTAAEIAEIVVTSFEEIELALSPIVGGRGVVALFSRSIQLASARHGWLRGDDEPSLTSLDFASLREALTRQELQEAAVGGNDLLHTFRTLLSTLIGASLTGKLLDPAWTHSPHETDVKKASA